MTRLLIFAAAFGLAVSAPAPATSTRCTRRQGRRDQGGQRHQRRAQQHVHAGHDRADETPVIVHGPGSGRDRVAPSPFLLPKCSFGRVPEGAAFRFHETETARLRLPFTRTSETPCPRWRDAMADPDRKHDFDPPRPPQDPFNPIPPERTDPLGPEPLTTDLERARRRLWRPGRHERRKRAAHRGRSGHPRGGSLLHIRPGFERYVAHGRGSEPPAATDSTTTSSTTPPVDPGAAAPAEAITPSSTGCAEPLEPAPAPAQ